jgi:hypothetical protein
MGVEYYLVCGQCKEYIDLHKAYSFSMVICAQRPPVGADCKESGFNDVTLKGGYWESRGLWFLWKHRGHKEIAAWSDTQDEWFDLEPNLVEVFPHEIDLEIRERVGSSKVTK